MPRTCRARAHAATTNHQFTNSPIHQFTDSPITYHQSPQQISSPITTTNHQHSPPRIPPLPPRARPSPLAQGESLLNDGTAMVIFLLFENMTFGKVYTVDEAVQVPAVSRGTYCTKIDSNTNLK
jgi:hypothetical protein